MQYEYFGRNGDNASRTISEDQAIRSIGLRVLVGFPVTSRTVEAPDGRYVGVTYFQSEVSGNVWALYYDDMAY